MQEINKVSVIGLGYVGLPLTCLISEKFEGRVVGFDVNQSYIAEIEGGSLNIADAKLSAAMQMTQNRVKTVFTSDSSELSGSDLFIVCVPTPVTDDRLPDFGPLEGALSSLASHMTPGCIVVVESTVFPGTCDDVVIPMLERLSGLTVADDFAVIHCPERINPGDKIWSTENIPRVIGGSSRLATLAVAEFYAVLMGGSVIEVSKINASELRSHIIDKFGNISAKQIEQGTVVVMESLRDAEAVKAMENTVRDVNIAFVNELAKIADALNVNIVDVIKGMATKPFGNGPYFPGGGVGGHCIAVDPEWLKEASIKNGYFPELIQLSRNINNGMPSYVVEQLRTLLDTKCEKIGSIKVLVLGLAYKKNVADYRESPSFQVIDILSNTGCEVLTFDPLLPELSTEESLYAALNIAEACILMTDHDSIVQDLESYDWSCLTGQLGYFVDGRNVIDSSIFPNQVSYKGIGR